MEEDLCVCLEEEAIISLEEVIFRGEHGLYSYTFTCCLRCGKWVYPASGMGFVGTERPEYPDPNCRVIEE